MPNYIALRQRVKDVFLTGELIIHLDIDLTLHDEDDRVAGVVRTVYLSAFDVVLVHHVELQLVVEVIVEEHALLLFKVLDLFENFNFEIFPDVRFVVLERHLLHLQVDVGEASAQLEERLTLQRRHGTIVFAADGGGPDWREQKPNLAEVRTLLEVADQDSLLSMVSNVHFTGALRNEVDLVGTIALHENLVLRTEQF